ncbi:hypothetical protein [Brachybacterium hainanense]|uniref:Thiosulfate dehydrogenase [quinone] large subunit n=1 Tax=Brachybacterium hainanense TaxID=1541174 RepID=A0ABV6RER7_9MICO
MNATIAHPSPAAAHRTGAIAPAAAEISASASQLWGHRLLGVVRILLGFTFLWAFLDKMLGLGFSTPAERSVLHGGSPTTGYLGGSIESGNPFAGVWEALIAINPVTDVLFLAGLLGIGLALLLGIGMRIATVSGAAMYLFMYLASFPMTTNPLYDDHLVMAVLLGAMLLLGAGDHLGFGRPWARLVRGNRVLV